MYKENKIKFNTEDEHAYWIKNNRRTGLKEIDCNIVDGLIEVKYIKLF